jgi:hypothetical protein
MKDENLICLLENQAINLAINILQQETNKLVDILKSGQVSDGTSDSLMAHYHFYVGKIEGLEYLKKYVNDLANKLLEKSGEDDE